MIFAATGRRACFTGHTKTSPLETSEETNEEGKGARCIVRVVPAVGTVREVARGIELEHGARVSGVWVVHQRVVAHHTCGAREGGGETFGAVKEGKPRCQILGSEERTERVRCR